LLNSFTWGSFYGNFFSALAFLAHYRKSDLTIIGPSHSKETIEKIFALTNAPGGLKVLQFKIHFKELTSNEEVQEILGEYKIKYAMMEHPILAFAYRVEKNGKVVCYSGDTKPNQKLINLANKSDIFICESTIPDNQAKFANKYGHCTPSDAARMARDADCEKLVLVHISPFFAEEIGRSINNIKKIFNKEILTAEDLMTLDIRQK